MFLRLYISCLSVCLVTVTRLTNKRVHNLYSLRAMKSVADAQATSPHDILSACPAATDVPLRQSLTVFAVSS